MYWTDLNGPDVVQRADIDGANVQALVTTGSYMVFSLDVDGAGGKVYYSDYTNGRIYRMNLDGSGSQILLSGCSGVYGLAVDATGGKIYWTETGTDKIRRANIDGSGAEDLITGLYNPLDVALDLTAGKMYFTDTDNRRICRANLDGSNMQVLVTNADDLRELVVDPVNGYIYWAEELAGRIRRSRLDGTSIVTILSGLTNPYGVALDVSAGKIYYTHHSVARANLDGSNPEDLVTSWSGGIALDYAVSSPTYSLSGTVFEDVNYGGGTGRTMAAAAGVGRPGATVELYNSSGAYLANTTTAADGGYSFGGLTAATYTVRVVNSTVTSSRSGSTGAELAVQTFRADGYGETAGTGATKVGGQQPVSVDAPANSGSDTLTDLQAPAGQYTQSIVSAQITSSDATAVDFGFNFDTIVNTNDSGQGSLRQFITNANLLANTGLDQDDWGVTKNLGMEHSIFMIPPTDGGFGSDPTGGSGSAFVIQISSSALPALTDADTSIDGRTQTAFTGDTNAAVTHTSTGPEIVVDYGGTLSDYLFHFQAARGYLYNLGIFRGGNGPQNKGAIFFDGVSASGAVARGLTVCQSGSHGFQILGSTGLTIADSVIRNNGTGQIGACGLTLGSSSAITVQNNTIMSNPSLGIEFWSGTCDNNVISGNYIAANGQSEVTSGIGLFAGSNNTISQNTITANSRNGIIVHNGAGGNTISMNAIYANGVLGIDLDAGTSYDGDGVTANDADDGDTGGNDLLNFPAITSATATGGVTTVNFDLDAPAGNYRIEFFKNPSGVDPTGYGEGESYAGAVSITHSGGGPRSFSHTFAGAVNDRISATATVDLGAGDFGATSEFSAVYTVTANLPAIVISKSVALISDPLNGTTNPIIIPGAVMQYSLDITNQGGSPDANTVIVTNPVGSQNSLFVGDLGGAGSGPVLFTDGSPASGMVCTFSGLSSTTDSIAFSNDNGATYTYTPVPDAGGYDSNVTHIRVTPSGPLAASDGTNHPFFTIQFRVLVR